MSKILEKLFKDLGKVKQINLSQECRDYFHFNKEKSPLLDAEFCEAWVKYIHKQHDINFSYGDYLFDRGEMLRGSYLKSYNAVHLGIDFSFSLPNIWVFSPLDGKIIDIFCDKDQNGGWGDRVTIEYKNGIVVFAHLSLWTMIPRPGMRVGNEIKAGDKIGAIGHPLQNGGWWPHLHLQGLRDISQLKNLDGYGTWKGFNPKDLYDALERDYPNPLKILELI